jgi:uncharacterized protein DUF2381
MPHAWKQAGGPQGVSPHVHTEDKPFPIALSVLARRGVEPTSATVSGPGNGTWPRSHSGGWFPILNAQRPLALTWRPSPPNRRPACASTWARRTTLVFGAPLLPGAAVLSDNRSLGLAKGDDFVTVYPKRSFLPGERVKLTVRFGDGAAPEEAAFWLVGRSAQGARSVECGGVPPCALGGRPPEGGCN